MFLSLRRTSFCIPSKDFAEQFAKDLKRDNFSLESLRWVFDGQKITRADLEKLREPLRKVIEENQLEVQASNSKKLDDLINEMLENIFIVSN